MVALMIHAMYAAIYYLQQAIGIQLYKLNLSNRKVFYPPVWCLSGAIWSPWQQRVYTTRWCVKVAPNKSETRGCT